MAIDPGDLQKIDVDLVKEPNMTFDYVIAAAEGGNTPKGITLETLLRTKVTEVLDETGKSSATIDYDDHSAIEVTVDEDITLGFSNIKDEETVWLKVIKGSADIVSFVSASGIYEIDSVQTGLTTLFFRITNYDTASETTLAIEPVITQFEDNAITLTPSAGTITVKDYFNSTINNNICEFEGSFTYNLVSSHTGIAITISNWNISKAESGSISCNSQCENGGGDITKSAKISATSLNIFFDGSYTGNTNVLVNGSFKII